MPRLSLTTILSLSLLLFSLILLTTHPLKEDQFNHLADEGSYFQYANAVSEKGLGELWRLNLQHMSSEEARNSVPSPYRAGFILPAALFIKLLGNNFEAVAALSYTAFLFFLLINYLFSQKYFGKQTALLFTVLLSSSPLMLGLSRRALIDSFLNLLWGSIIWIFLDYLIHRKKRSLLMTVILLSFAVLTKESSLVLLPFLFIMMLSQRYFKHPPVPWAHLAAITLGPLCIVVFCEIIFLGGIQNLLQTAHAIFLAHFAPNLTNQYILAFESGPWFRFLVDFLLLSPVTTLCFIGYSAHVVLNKKTDFKTVYFLLYFVIIYGLINCVPHNKNARNVVNLEMAMFLLTVLGLEKFFDNHSEKIRRWGTLILVGAIYIFNIMSFISIFITNQIYDPVSYNLLVVRGLIPSF